LSHTDRVVRLYLQETLTFLLLTTEAAVALRPPRKEAEMNLFRLSSRCE